MSDGEVFTQKFKVLIQKPLEPVTPLDLPSSRFEGVECCDELIVLADAGSTDEFKNDCASFIIMQNEFVTGIVLKLEKKESGVWVEKTSLIDQTFGEFFDFGFFQNTLFENAIGINLDFKTILATYGEGCFRIKTEETTILAGEINNYSPVYTLKQYTQARADETIRLEWYNNSLMGVSERDTRLMDFKNIGDVAGVDQRGWKNCIRLKGIFYFSESEYTRETTKYKSGRLEKYLDEQTPIYKLDLKRYGAYIHNLLRTNEFTKNKCAAIR
jgi:hypothetical protein